MVTDAIESLDTQIEWHECDVGTPLGVIESVLHVRAERVLAGMATRAMPTVVTECNGFGQYLIEPKSSADRGCYLGNFERMGEASALVVFGEDKDLGFAGKTAKGGGVEDAISVAFKTGAEGIGLFGDCAVAGTK